MWGGSSPVRIPRFLYVYGLKSHLDTFLNSDVICKELSMSRSYRKYPCYKGGHWLTKRDANKAVRQYKSYLSNGRAYRKISDSWDICDWKSVLFSDSEQKVREQEYLRDQKDCGNIYSNPFKMRRKSLTNYFNRDTIRK